MVDFVVFLSSQLFNLINFFDSIILFGGVSLLKVFIIVVLFLVAIKFFTGGKK